MSRFFDPSLIARTYRDPLAWISLGVDLLPIWAIWQFGWGATPLVALYWLENLVLGAATLARIIIAGAAGKASLFGAIFLSAFFTLHYGLFCFGHGAFLVSLAGSPGVSETPAGLINWALGTGPYMAAFVAAIAGVNALYFAVDFIAKGEFRRAQPTTLMFAPYGRIIALHIAIIIGAALAFSANEPLAGVLGLLVLRFVFGIGLSLYRRLRLDQRNLKVDA